MKTEWVGCSLFMFFSLNVLFYSLGCELILQGEFVPRPIAILIWIMVAQWQSDNL